MFVNYHRMDMKISYWFQFRGGDKKNQLAKSIYRFRQKTNNFPEGEFIISCGDQGCFLAVLVVFDSEHHARI